MRPALVAALSLSLLSACGIKEERFQGSYTTRACDRLLECSPEDQLPYEDYEACVVFVSAAWAPRTGGCDYDGRAAKACLSDYEGLSCSDAEPSACGDAYTGPSCDWGGDWTDDSSDDSGR